MAGIVYMKSNSSVSLTGAEYTGISIPSGCKTLYIQTGNATSDRIKYGLTTDPTATSYSPVINVSGTTMMIAKQSTISETVTTGTVYHTDTRASTSKTNYKFDTASASAKSSILGSFAPNTTSYSAVGLTNYTQIYNDNTVSYTGTFWGNNYKTYTTSGTMSAYTNASQISKNWNVNLRDWGSSTGLITYNDNVDTVSAAWQETATGMGCRAWYESIKGKSSQSKRVILESRPVVHATGSKNSYTVKTKIYSNQYDYETCSSTYTSRTEYLTSLSTYTTNNAA